MNEPQRYQLHHTLKGHTREINCVQISQDGVFLASGADDGYIFLWSISEGTPVQKLSPKQGPIVVLKWLNCPHISQTSYFLVSGGADGTLKLWKKSDKQNLFYFASMHSVGDTAIEDIALEESHLAVVGSGRLSLLSLDVNQKEVFRHISTEPQMKEPAFPALARTVHFINSGRSIMVAFLDAKEIIAWNISPWSRIWRHRVPTRIGNTAWLNTTQTLLIWNLMDGVDVYHVMERPVWTGKLRIEIKRNLTVQVVFGPHGRTGISGSDSGEIYIWDLTTGKPSQILIHLSGARAIQTVTHHSPQHNKHFLVSASSDPGDRRPTIAVWSNTPKDEPSSWWRTYLILSASLLAVGLGIYLSWTRFIQMLFAGSYA